MINTGVSLFAGLTGVVNRLPGHENQQQGASVQLQKAQRGHAQASQAYRKTGLTISACAVLELTSGIMTAQSIFTM
jgi:hypothetical protein